MAIGPVLRDLTAPGHEAAAPAAPAAPPSRLPAPGWPQKADLDYLKVAIELGLLLLAIPYLLHRLATKPTSTARKAGESKLK